MKRFLAMDTWDRKDIFEWFVKYEEPFFGLCVDIDCTNAYEKCKREGYSFFLYYLHKTLAAANSIEPFRYRIEDGRVIVYDEVHAGPTIMRPNGTFGFSDIRFHKDFETFHEAAKKEVARVKQDTVLLPPTAQENVIHCSAVPWVKFTALSHARSYSTNDSAPKVSYGKMTETNGRRTMPVSVHVHHALADGYHASLFIDEFQRLMNE